ncbi:hypothetical protein OJF2_36960 [Aquisphaera giovannonii]|uniref:Uncharacterized protein n=1 Tax=Aquisphaera giovannonii TaxID=406548 RepID=A0A5B9W549_9BACT|nr:hypothetical protein [Aquisphaera giovannonii]QEH35151.1 hypothetical protein OJF2_36960 [Aquisphaera giovannonii]
MNQIIDRRRFCGLTGLLALGGLVASGCGEDMSQTKNIQVDTPPLESAKDSMENYRKQHENDSKSKKR